MRSVIILILVAFGATPVLANNNNFLPGDTFFHAVLTEADLDRIDKEENPTFRYDRPDFMPSYLCGYAGFSQLEYTAMPKALKQHLRKAYRDLREFHPKRIEITKSEDPPQEVQTEINGFNLLFYNKDFNLKRFRLGLKYNEKWLEDITAFGHDRRHVQFEFFVDKPKAIMEDWRDGSLVPPLKAKLPQASPKALSTPIKVGGDVQIFIMPEEKFGALYSAPEVGWGSFSIYRITADGVQRMTGKSGHWEPHKPSGLGFGSN